MSKTLVQHGPADGSDTAYVEIVSNGSAIEYKVNGTQQSALTDLATDLTAADADVQTIAERVNEIIAALEATGIIDS